MAACIFPRPSNILSYYSYQLDAVLAEVCHDSLGARLRGVAHMRGPVAEGLEQHRQHHHDIGLEQELEPRAEAFEGVQAALFGWGGA